MRRIRLEHEVGLEEARAALLAWLSASEESEALRYLDGLTPSFADGVLREQVRAYGNTIARSDFNEFPSVRKRVGERLPELFPDLCGVPA